MLIGDDRQRVRTSGTRTASGGGGGQRDSGETGDCADRAALSGVLMQGNSAFLSISAELGLVQGTLAAATFRAQALSSFLPHSVLFRRK